IKLQTVKNAIAFFNFSENSIGSVTPSERCHRITHLSFSKSTGRQEVFCLQYLHLHSFVPLHPVHASKSSVSPGSYLAALNSFISSPGSSALCSSCVCPSVSASSSSRTDSTSEFDSTLGMHEARVPALPR